MTNAVSTGVAARWRIGRPVAVVTYPVLPVAAARVSVTSGSAAVTGGDTLFLTRGVVAGWAVAFGSQSARVYTVESVASETSVTLTEVYDGPSATATPIMISRPRASPVGQPWLSAGSVSLVHGSATVSGTGTAWLSGARPGAIFTRDKSRLYEVGAIASDGELVLAEPYQGPTEVGAPYALITGTGVPLAVEVAAQLAEVIQYSRMAQEQAAEAMTALRLIQRRVFSPSQSGSAIGMRRVRFGGGGEIRHNRQVVDGDGGVHDFYVPVSTSWIGVKAWGAGGGGTSVPGGGGGYATARLPVIGGETLTVKVGTGGVGSVALGGAGWPDGGYGGSRAGYMGAGGGGSTSIWRGNQCLIVAGGGGAGGAANGSATGSGGAGGGATGGNAPPSPFYSASGKGGTQSSGGSGGTGYAGGQGSAFKGGDGMGNNGAGNNGTGGGGGYFGGGGGVDHQGGGGGSAWAISGAETVVLMGGSGQSPGNDADSERGSAGAGGAGGFGTGGFGRIVIGW